MSFGFRPLSFLLLFLLLSFSHQGITLVNPSDLITRLKGRVLTASYGNFGRIYSGFSTRGRIYMTNPNSQTQNYACQPLKDL